MVDPSSNQQGFQNNTLLYLATALGTLMLDVCLNHGSHAKSKFIIRPNALLVWKNQSPVICLEKVVSQRPQMLQTLDMWRRECGERITNQSQQRCCRNPRVMRSNFLSRSFTFTYITFESSSRQLRLLDRMCTFCSWRHPRRGGNFFTFSWMWFGTCNVKNCGIEKAKPRIKINPITIPMFTTNKENLPKLHVMGHWKLSTMLVANLDHLKIPYQFGMSMKHALHRTWCCDDQLDRISKFILENHHTFVRSHWRQACKSLSCDSSHGVGASSSVMLTSASGTGTSSGADDLDWWSLMIQSKTDAMQMGCPLVTGHLGGCMSWCKDNGWHPCQDFINETNFSSCTNSMSLGQTCLHLMSVQEIRACKTACAVKWFWPCRNSDGFFLPKWQKPRLFAVVKPFGLRQRVSKVGWHENPRLGQIHSRHCIRWDGYAYRHHWVDALQPGQERRKDSFPEGVARQSRWPATTCISNHLTTPTVKCTRGTTLEIEEILDVPIRVKSKGWQLFRRECQWMFILFRPGHDTWDHLPDLRESIGFGPRDKWNRSKKWGRNQPVSTRSTTRPYVMQMQLNLATMESSDVHELLNLALDMSIGCGQGHAFQNHHLNLQVKGSFKHTSEGHGTWVQMTKLIT